MKSTFLPLSLAVAIGATSLLSTGCATKKYVRTEVDEVETILSERDNALESQIESNQTRISDQDVRIDGVSATAREALERALEAGKLAEGKLLFETVLTDHGVHFGFNQSEVSDAAKQALDNFALQAKSDNKEIFVEIQGHTDATGSEDYNLKLGEERAEAVRRYLSLEHKLPLHRMSVISYGESAPTSDNSTREGRSMNRRVVLVVLR